MDRKENVVSNYRSIVDYMSKVINDKFIKIQKELSSIKDYESLIVVIYDKRRQFYCLNSSAYKIKGKWFFDFRYEDDCCSNELPCKDYKDSIIGMTTKEVENFFLASDVKVVDYHNWNKVIKEFNI